VKKKSGKHFFFFGSGGVVGSTNYKCTWIYKAMAWQNLV